jgi:transcriptional regulator with XRE-family HTH domain
MSNRRTDVIDAFGERLATLRKAAGYTQVEFAAEVGVTQRMVAYYEAPGAKPPAHLLPQMAQVLGVGADVLLGMAQPRQVKRQPPNGLARRLLEIEKLIALSSGRRLALSSTLIKSTRLSSSSNNQT